VKFSEKKSAKRVSAVYALSVMSPAATLVVCQ